MAIESIELDAGSGGAKLAVDTVDTDKEVQYVKLMNGTDGDATPIPGGADGLLVDLGANNDVVVTNAGTFVTQEDGAALTALQTIDNIVVVEDTAHSTGDSGVMSLAVRNDTLAALAGADGDYTPLQVDANGALFIQEGAALDVSAATVTVAGTVTADLGATDNAVLDQLELNTSYGDNTGGGVEAGSLRVTIANDSTGVVSIDDNAGSLTVDNAGAFATQIDGDALTALQLIDNIVLAEDAVHSTGASGVMPLAVRNDTLAALAGTDGDYAPLQVNATGALFIQEGAPLDVSGATVIVDGSAVTQPVSGTVTANLGATDNAVLDAIDAVLDAINAKLVTGTVIGDVNLGATDNAVLDTIDAVLDLINAKLVTGTVIGDVNLGAVDNAVLDAIAASVAGTVTVDGSGVTQPVSGSVTANLSATDNAVLDTIDAVLDLINAKLVTGTVIGDVNLGATDNAVLDDIAAQATTIAAAVSTEMQTDIVGALPAGANLVGDVGISGARTSGGTTLYKNIDVDESEDQVKGSAGQVYWIHAINLTAAVVFLKFYNATAASVTVGTTVPDLTFPIPTQGDTNGAGFTLSIPNGIAFGTAITIACTTGIADADSGAPAANACVVNLGYA